MFRKTCSLKNWWSSDRGGMLVPKNTTKFLCKFINTLQINAISRYFLYLPFLVKADIIGFIFNIADVLILQYLNECKLWDFKQVRKYAKLRFIFVLGIDSINFVRILAKG